MPSSRRASRRKMTAKELEKNRKKSGVHPDTDGLVLVVRGKSATWRFRFTIKGRRRDMGLGSAWSVGLGDARDARDAAKVLVDKGVDPIDHKRDLQRRKDESAARTFGTVADRFVAERIEVIDHPTTRRQWVMAFSRTFASLRDMPIADIDAKAVTSVLDEPFRKRPKSASKDRAKLEELLENAKSRGLRDGENPASWTALKPVYGKALKAVRKKVNHHRALPKSEAPALYRDLCRRSGPAMVALRFMLLTIVRTAEVRRAKWADIDWGRAVWTIGESDMKARREHDVPLSRQAMDLLREQRKLSDGALIFEGLTRGRPIGESSMRALVRRMGFKTTPHGLRSTFRDWTDIGDRPLAEMALAHGLSHALKEQMLAEMVLAQKVAGDTEAAYWRDRDVEARRPLMQRWGDYLEMVDNAESTPPAADPPAPALEEETAMMPLPVNVVEFRTRPASAAVEPVSGPREGDELAAAVASANPALRAKIAAMLVADAGEAGTG